MANSGIEATTVLNIEIARSSRERSRMPASTPKSIESGTMQAKAMRRQQQRCCRAGPR